MKILKFFSAKRIIFSFLGTIILGLSGCFERGDNVMSYDLIPAIVGYSYQTFQPTLKTPGGTFLAPELQNNLFVDLMEGDAILTSFYINYNEETLSEYFTAYNVLYTKVDKGWPQTTFEGESTGNYDVPIESMSIYGGVEYLWFFVFRHTANYDQSFAYEMTYDEYSTDEIPTVYIRAKKYGQQGSATTSTFDYPYAFDMKYFIETHKDANNRIKFKIKYKTGVDDDGNDKYSDYIDSQFGGEIIDFQIE